MGIAIAATTRVGTQLGTGNHKQAKFSASVSFLLCVTCMVVNGLLLFVFRHLVGRIFTTEADVLELVAQVVPVAAFFQVFDGAQVCCNGL